MWPFDKLNAAYCCLDSVLRFRGYRPQSVTFAGVRDWLSQFERPKDRSYALRALRRVTFLTERRVQDALVNLNKCLLKRLLKDEIDYDHVIYMQIHDPGSSSPVILNTIRNLAGLEERGCHF